jgi:hypothetical protein
MMNTARERFEAVSRQIAALEKEANSLNSTAWELSAKRRQFAIDLLIEEGFFQSSSWLICAPFDSDGDLREIYLELDKSSVNGEKSAKRLIEIFGANYHDSIILEQATSEQPDHATRYQIIANPGTITLRFDDGEVSIQGRSSQLLTFIKKHKINVVKNDIQKLLKRIRSNAHKLEEMLEYLES